MSNNSIINVLFEEIKSRVTSIENKIDKISAANNAEKKETTLPVIPNEVDYSRIEEIVKEQFSKIEQSASEPKPQRHYHILYLKSTKVLVVFVVMSLLLNGALYYNVRQYRENKRLNDMDIKYRYIKASNGISPEEIDKLEDVFHYNRDTKMVKEIRRDVIDHERKAKKRAEDLERARFKEAQAKELRMEAEELRGKE